MSLSSNFDGTFSECGSLLLQQGRRYEHSDKELYKSSCTDVCLALHPRPAPNMFGLFSNRSAITEPF